jgi:glycosyltransferase involved in cell wall biosynthesis
VISLQPQTCTLAGFTPLPEPKLRRSGRPSILFIAANQGVPWGASEFLWAGAARALATRADAAVTVCVKGWSAGLQTVQQLRSSGCKILIRPTPEDEQAFERCEVPPNAAREILRLRPDLVVISHGDNREGLPWMEFCAAQNLQYVTVAHRASECDWPDQSLVPRLRLAYLGARAAHFVSAHNRGLTEQMICTHLRRAAIVRNPFNVSYSDVPPWPADDATFRMACVARLDLESKAHDVLFNVLAAPKWRRRALHVDVVGREGPHSRFLSELSEFLKLEQVSFQDSVDDIRSVWARCHALVLPSRKEGLPVAIVEAMLSGRPCVVTDVGGCSEVVEHGRSGWVAESPTVKALDRALDLAWESRVQWASMGAFAARIIRSLVPADPAGSYADVLMKILREGDHDN